MTNNTVDMVKPLNIDQLLINLPKNRIDQVGVELEGGWGPTLPMGARIDVDTSVKIKTTVEIPHVGEIHSQPMQPAQMALWIKKYYPIKVDKTCGLHVHMSFPPATNYYSLLTDEAYQETIFEYLAQWGKAEDIPKTHCFWERLTGDAWACKKIHWPDLQIRQKKKDHDRDREGNRYTALNYCIEQHGTLECRLLPMFEDANQAIRAVRRVIDITNASLVMLGKKREETMTALVSVPHESYVERVREVI